MPEGAPAAPPAALRHERVMLVTDAWTPQVNGVVRTLEILGKDLQALGHEVRYATPEGRFTVPMPTYPEIRLAIFPRKSLEAMIADFQPTAIHIATEGTLGLSARAICVKQAIPFTTSFHTRFPEYVKARVPFVPVDLVYSFLRWFHGPAKAMMVATPSLLHEMESHGFTNCRIWSRGVDVEQFRPIPGAAMPFPGPIWLSVGRVAVEKNLEAFLSLDLPGTKVVIGDGPARTTLEKKYPDAKFLGPKTGEDLVRDYAASDVFVFPSKTDTFGLVLLEALACGVPVAAYPVQGPLDVIGGANAHGALDNDLRSACPAGAGNSARGRARLCADAVVAHLHRTVSFQSALGVGLANGHDHGTGIAALLHIVEGRARFGERKLRGNSVLQSPLRHPGDDVPQRGLHAARIVLNAGQNIGCDQFCVFCIERRDVDARNAPRGEAGNDHAPSRRQRKLCDLGCVSTHRIEDYIHASAVRQRRDRFRQRSRCAVDQLVRAAFLCVLRAPFRRHREHVRAQFLADLDGGHTRLACRPQNQQGLVGTEPCLVAQGLQRARTGDREASGNRQGQAIRQAGTERCLRHSAFGEPTPGGKGRHTITGFETLYARANRGDQSGNLQARDKGQSGSRMAFACQRGEIGKVDTGRRHADQNLSGTGRRGRDIVCRQCVEPDQPVCNQCFHGATVPWARPASNRVAGALRPK